MRVKVSEGKTKDVAIIDVTPENYIVPDNEKHLYHCVIEIKKFDSETGKRLSIPRIQKFGKKGYENSIADNLKKQGYTITVLHDPNEYMKAKAEADEKAKAEKAKANAEKAAADAKAKQEAADKAKKEEDERIAKAVADALAKQAEENQKAIDAAVAKALEKQAPKTEADKAKAEDKPGAKK